MKSLLTSGLLNKLPELNDKVIVDFAKKNDLILMPVSKYTVPKFRLPITNLNYSLLILKALYI
jgi:hypothetical protein